jgi:hypothetical protein
MNDIKEFFKEQIRGGATDKFFYGIYGKIEGTLSIQCHRGPLQTLSLDGLAFDRMQESTPFFKIVEVNE